MVNAVNVAPPSTVYPGMKIGGQEGYTFLCQMKDRVHPVWATVLYESIENADTKL